MHGSNQLKQFGQICTARTKYLKLLMRKEGFNFNTTAEFEIVRSIKEVINYAAIFFSSNPVLKIK